MFNPFNYFREEKKPKVVKRSTEKITEKQEFELATVKITLNDGSSIVKEGVVKGLEGFEHVPLAVKSLEVDGNFDLDTFSWPYEKKIIYRVTLDNHVSVAVTNRRTIVVEGEATVTYNEMSDGSKEYTGVEEESVKRYFKESDDADS